MKKLILIAGAAALATTAPLAAKPDQAKGNSQGKHGNMNQGARHSKASGMANRVNVRGDRFGNRYALDARGFCPPGLAKKNNGCMAPGQAKKLFNVGQRYNQNAGNMWDYNQIPGTLRSQYGLDQSDRYYYNNGYLYQVDPRTRLIERVISTILR